VPQAPKPVPEVATAPPSSKSKAGLVIGIGVVFVLLLVAGVGGFLIWNKSRSSGTANTSNTGATAEVANTPREVSRYWLELEPQVAGGKTTRVAGLVPLASGQFFRFHFTFDDDGYLYIFGPGNGNQPTAFLTTKPSAQTGLTSNKVSKGVDFSFPKGKENLLSLDKNPGTDNFTVIFSRTPLPSPSFLNDPVTGEPLSAAQEADLKTFVSRFQGKQPVPELDESDARAPLVRVKATPGPSSDPIVFDIRIQHN
jgi:uncharacterized protein DUF4384